MKILVADDDPVSRVTLTAALSAAGHSVIEVADGLAAWDVLRQPDAPKLAVIAWRIPGVEGLELIRRMAASSPDEPLYSIVLTACDGEGDVVCALGAGANDYLTKPFRTAELLARVQVGARVVELQASLSRRLRELDAAMEGRVQAESALVHEQYCLRALMDNVPYAIYFKDQSSRFTQINAEQCRRLGLADPKHAEGRCDRDFFGDEHAAQSLADEERIMRTGEPMIEKEEEETWPDGRITWAASTKMALRNAAGETVGTFGISRDITTRRQSDEASRFLATIVESSDDAITSIDLNGTIMSWNRGAECLYGYSAEDVVGKSDLLLIPDDRADELIQIVEEVGQGERILHLETQRVTRDGRQIDVSLTISPITDASGATVRAAMVARDITRRKKIEDELHESRLRLQLILDSIPQRVFWKDQNCRYLGCNKAFALDAGLRSASEIPGKTDFDLIWRASAAEFQADDRLVMSREESKLHYDERLMKPDGTTQWLRTSKLPLRDRSGAVMGVLGTYEDITERKRADEALLASERRYRLLFERNLAGVFRTSLDGRLLECNQSAAKILGFASAAEVCQIPMEDLHETPAARAAFVERLTLHRSLSNLELKLRARDGSPVWVMANVSLVEPPEGDPIIEGTVIDITENKRAQEAIAEEGRLVALRAQIGDALLNAGAIRQGLQKCTDALVEHTGVAFARIWILDSQSQKLLLNASSGLYTHIDGAHGVISVGRFKIGRIAERQLPHLSNAVQDDPEVADHEWAKREGMVSFVGYPLIVGDHVVGVVAAFGRKALGDATLIAFSSIAGQIAQFIQAKRAEEAMLRSEERARLLFATIPHPAYVFDLETLDFLEVNEVAIRRYGYSRDEFLCMKISELRAVEGADFDRRGGQGKHRTRDGRAIDVEINLQVLDYDGRRAAITIAQDVTERNSLEVGLRHAQKLEAVGRLASGIAHEINTPIQFVGDNIRFLQDGFASQEKVLKKIHDARAAAERNSAVNDLLCEVSRLIEEEDLHYLEDEIPKALSQSLDGVGRVATIVRAMKEFAHPEQGQRAAADLNKAIASTLVVAGNQVKYVADVVTDFGDLPPVECYLGDLNQVFLNLLVNAAQAIEETAGRSGVKGLITIRTRLEGDHVLIAVSDTGGGIPEVARSKVFEPFFTTKDVGRGTGQGLAISRSIVVEKHGGTLTFESQTGRGTTFWVSLPVSKAAPQPSPGHAVSL